MSNLTPEQLSITANSSSMEIAKALGYGNITNDQSLLTQGGAASVQSLEDTITEMRIQRSDMEVLRSIKGGQAGQVVDNWIEEYALGGSRGDAISNMEGSTKESVQGVRRRTENVKFFTQRASISETLIKSPNFMQQLNNQDVLMLTRIDRDHAWMIYEGSKFASSDHEYDGLAEVAQDADRANWDGEHVVDVMDLSGLDQSGMTNPADIETAMRRLSAVIARPVNGVGKSPSIYMGSNTYQTVQNYKNFESYQVLGGSAQGVVTGSVIPGFANAYAGKVGEVAMTKIMVDMFLPDASNEWTKSAETLGTAVAGAPAPTVTAAAGGSNGDSRFTAQFAGSYYYFVAPEGVDLSTETGTEGPAGRLAAAVAVTAGQQVTVTVTRAAGGKESGYRIYRSRKGGTADINDARLIARVGATGSVTTWVDRNRDLPNAVKVYVADLTNPEVMNFQHLFQAYRVELPRSGQRIFNIPVAVGEARYLRVRKTRHIGLIKNVQSDPLWNPLG